MPKLPAFIERKWNELLTGSTSKNMECSSGFGLSPITDWMRWMEP